MLEIIWVKYIFETLDVTNEKTCRKRQLQSVLTSSILRDVVDVHYSRHTHCGFMRETAPILNCVDGSYILISLVFTVYQTKTCMYLLDVCLQHEHAHTGTRVFCFHNNEMLLQVGIEMLCLVIQFCVISCSDLSVSLFSKHVQCSESYDDEPQRQRDVVMDARKGVRRARGHLVATGFKRLERRVHCLGYRTRVLSFFFLSGCFLSLAFL